MDKKSCNEDMEDTSLNISESIEKLKLVLEKKHKNLRLPPNGDDFLERSLHHRKFDMNQAADQVHSFFKLCAELREKNDKDILTPSSYKSYFFDSFGVSVLTRSDLQEQPMLFVNFDVLPVETLSIDKLIAVCILVMIEIASYPLHVQNMGLVIVVNLKTFQFGHVKKFNLSQLQLAAKVLHGSLPVRFKAIHFINAPSIFWYTYTLLRLILRKKIKDRIHVHGNDITEVYKVADRKLLPVKLGGELSNEESMDIKFIEELCQKDDYYQKFAQYGYYTQKVEDD